MRGKHRVELRHFPRGAEMGEILDFGAGGKRGEVGLRLGRRDKAVQPVSAVIQCVAFEFGDQRRAIVERQPATFQFTRQVERELEHRVEQRRLFGPFVQALQAVEEVAD